MEQWKDGVCYHPVFSMSPEKLLVFSRNEWQRLAQRAADGEIGDNEATMLRVCFLALLYSLDSVKQEEASLPPLVVVQSTIEGLFSLAGWKFYLESNRFRFPTLHICSLNDNIDFSNIKDYINLCFSVKEDYETKVNEVVEKEKIAAAERAMVALRNEWITPVSRKMLFQWVRAHLEEKYQADAMGWLSTIFLGSERTIQDFEEEDILLFEEIILSSCPIGSTISKAVRDRVEACKLAWTQHHEAWDIDLSDDEWELDEGMKLLVNGNKQEKAHPGDEPKINDFQTRGSYLQAQARWTIAMAQWNKAKEITHD
jgi:hypothetical protein